MPGKTSENIQLSPMERLQAFNSMLGQESYLSFKFSGEEVSLERTGLGKYVLSIFFIRSNTKAVFTFSLDGKTLSAKQYQSDGTKQKFSSIPADGYISKIRTYHRKPLAA